MRNCLVFRSAALAMLALAAVGPSVARAQDAAEPDQRERLLAALNAIRSNHVDEAAEQKLVTAAIHGMMRALDPQAIYLDQRRFRDMQISGLGPEGFGFETVIANGFPTVITSLDGSPAAAAGILPRDVITHVDGVSLQGLDTYDAMDKMLGPPKSRGRLTIKRAGSDGPIEVTVGRDRVNMRSVRIRQDGDDLAHIRISWIYEGTPQQLRKALHEFSLQHPVDKLKGYVLDLRNNPGGWREAAVAIADLFLEGGEIVSIRGRDPAQTERFYAQPGDIIDGKPLIVLMNDGSADGAEIISAALQHHKRAIIVGTRSFGKGWVPSLLVLGRGQGAIRLISARYFTPAGRTFDGVGIDPDIEVQQDFPHSPENDRALILAFNLLRGHAVHAAFPPNPTP